MTVTWELLWKAWPDGFLALRGVKTVEGWQYIWEPGWEQAWIPPYGAAITTGDWPDVDAAKKRGDLLPNVDPTDVATWACLLADLAEAFGRTETNLFWLRIPNPIITVKLLKNHGGWMLMSGTFRESKSVGPLFDIDTDDPALALVLARIKVREETGQ